MKKKILFLTTGGTIASAPTEAGLAPALSSQQLLDQLPEIAQLCDADAVALCNLDSTNIGPEHWLMIARAIRQNYSKYDGFIIAHGTDTLAYTAAALSYLIQNSSKPIILTGAQKPICSEITDAKKNLRDSVLCALDPGSFGVMVVFGGVVIAGTRAKKVKTYSYNAFESINFPVLAQVQEDRVVRYIQTPMPSGPAVFYDQLDPKAFLMKLTPGIQPELLEGIFHRYDCLLLESFGVGGVPDNLVDALAEQLDKYPEGEKLLIMTTQVAYEGSDVGIYAVGRQLQQRVRFLEARDMTLEAAYTKAMWIMGQKGLSFEQIQELFYCRINYDIFCGQ